MKKSKARVIMNADDHTRCGDLNQIETRARAAGARGDLEVLGCGATATVVKDSRGRCFKTQRGNDASTRALLRDEAAWLQAAQAVPGVREHVVRVHRWHEQQGVIERACVSGRTARWSEESKVANLHAKISDRMKTATGFGRPEFKGDSWVLTSRGRRPILVDAGFANRFGRNLANHVIRVLAGAADPGIDTPSDLAFAVRWEKGDGRISAKMAETLERRLAKCDKNWKCKP